MQSQTRNQWKLHKLPERFCSKRSQIQKNNFAKYTDPDLHERAGRTLVAANEAYFWHSPRIHSWSLFLSICFFLCLTTLLKQQVHNITYSYVPDVETAIIFSLVCFIIDSSVAVSSQSSAQVLRHSGWWPTLSLSHWLCAPKGIEKRKKKRTTPGTTTFIIQKARV